MAGLALMLVTLFLISEAKSYTFALIPMIFMYVTTVAALIYVSGKLLYQVAAGKVAGAVLAGNLIAGLVGVLLVICALILAYDGIKAFGRYKAERAAAGGEKVPV